MRSPTRPVAALLALAAVAAGATVLLPVRIARADVFVLLNGDRITGNPYLRGTKFVRIDTGYGKLRIPLARIERIIGDDGDVEILNPRDSAAPAPAVATGPGPTLALEIEGNVFWYAWGLSDEEEADTTMHLVVSLDEDVVAVYKDPVPNPSNIDKAVVNSFSFRADETRVENAEGVVAYDADVTPGRIALKLDLPPAMAGDRLLELTYRCPPKRGEPMEDVAGGGAIVRLEPRRTTTVHVAQDAGEMGYSGFLGRFGRKMKKVETFRVDLSLEDPEGS